MRILIAGLMTAGTLIAGGCASQNETVTRVDPERGGVDVNSQFNARDAQQMAAELIGDMLSKPWIPNATAKNAAAGAQDPRPMVILGTVKNETKRFEINMGMVTDQVQEELLNSGKARVFAARDLRQELRTERFDTEFADPASVLKKANEKKAQFMIMGVLLDDQQVSGDGRTKDLYFQLKLEMTDIETTEKVWIRSARVRKVSTR